MSDFRMPSLGADMEAGTLVEWLRQPGDELRRGDVIAVVETQKGAIEIEVFQDGVLEAHLVSPGAVLPVGAAMARISGEGEAPTPAAAPAPAPVRAPRAEAAPEITPPPVGPRASPAARKLALELGVDLASVRGTGPAGAITLADIEAAKGAAAPERKPPGFDFSAMRAAIAAAMARSKREIPHYYLSQSVDIGAAQHWIAKENEERPPAERIIIGALYVKAVAKAACAYPEFNGFYADGRFQPSASVHAGVAIAIRGGGLAAPAVHNTAELDLATLMARMRDLVARVRAGRFKSSEISDPTITITSLGDRGVDAVWGVIYPPQVAIVGFGRIVERACVVDGALVARPTVCVTLAADHRVSDGHRGALFLEHIGQLLAEPGKL
jgi:pyruvate dehydrogenase E2 component (dihydrolipoamide acetyltransferase)